MLLSKNSIVGLCGLLCLLLAAGGSVQADHVYWMNPSGGLWNVGSNWNTGTPPTAADIAYINYDGTFTVTLNTNATVLGLNIGGFSGTQTLLCNSWELTVNGSLNIDNNGALDLQSSAVHTSGDFILTNDGNISCDNSDIELKIENAATMLVTTTCSFARTFLNDTTGTLTLEGNPTASADLTVAGTFTNRGTIDMTSSWPVTTTTAILTVPNEPLVNEPTGQINALLGASFTTASTRQLEAEIQNAGTITAVSTGMSILAYGAAHTNSGMMYAQGGTISFSQLASDQTFESTGDITTDPGAGLAFAGDTCWISTAGLANSGTLSFLSAEVYFDAAFLNDGRIELTGTNTNLSLADTLYNDGTLYMVNANLIGSAPIVNLDSLKLVNSDVDVKCINDGVVHATINGEFAGEFVSMPGSKVVSEATASNWCIVAFDHSWVNHGEIELTQSGWQSSYVSLLNLADTLVNAVDGVITAAAGTGSPAGSRYISAQLINAGAINVTGASLYISQSGAVHENSGSITLTGGNATVSDKFAHTGDIAIDTTYQFVFNGTKATLAGGSITGTGRFDNDNDTLHVTGPVSNAARMYLGEGTLLIDDTLTNDHMLYFGGTDGTGTGAILNRGDLNLAGGSSVGFSIVNEGMLVAELTNTIGGTFSNGMGDTTVVLGNSLGSAALTISNGFSNYGTILLTSEVVDDVTTATLAVSSGSLTNSTSGVIVSDAGQSTGGERYLTAQVVNQGTIRSSGLKLVVNKSSAAHSNSGTLEVGDAAMEFTLAGGGTLSNSGEINLNNLATLTIDQGSFTNTIVGRVTGTGSMNLYTTTLSFDGYIEPGESPGRINMQTNNFDMDTDAQLNIEIAGLTATTEHDQLYITENAGFGGVLDVDLIDGYIPSVGDSFKVCAYNARTGNFLGILGLSQHGVIFDTNFTADGLWIVTDSIDNEAPVISGMPSTLEFANDTTGYLLIWNYVSDDWTSDTNMTYDFVVSNDSLLYNLNAAGVLVLTAESGFTGAVELVLTATDEHGASATDTTTVTVAASNTPPAITGLPADVEFRTDSTYELDIFAAVSDAETDDSLLAYTFTTGNDSLVASWTLATGIVTMSATGGFVGSADLVIDVEDGDGGSAHDTVSITVTAMPAVPPVVDLPDSVGFDANDSATLDIFALVTDDSDDTLLTYTFSVSNDSLFVAFDSATGVLTLTADIDYAGVCWLRLEVTDPGALGDEDSCEVYVFPSLGAGDPDEPALPIEFALAQNYPNPFNPSTTIEFSLPVSGPVRLVVYNILGEAVRTLTDRTWPAGTHRLIWRGTDQRGRSLSSGVYFYRLESNDFSATRKMLLLK